MNKFPYILDCETTGVSNNPKTERPDIIELAYLKLDNDFNSLKTKPDEYLNSSFFKKRFKPEISIHPEATKIHGLKYKDLLSEEKSSTSLNHVPKDISYLIGHKISFDYRCIGKPENVKLICTEKLARKVIKAEKVEIKSLKLDDLISFYFPEKKDILINQHHSASGDCLKTLFLLTKFLEIFKTIESYEELYKFIERKSF